MVVVVNLSGKSFAGYRIGVPREGRWSVRFNSDWAGYDSEFGGPSSFDTDALADPLDGMASSLVVGLGPYACVIMSQDE